jgi:uncharacterized protein YndB with AHSA1/START domain
MMATTTMANPQVVSNPAENLKLQLSRVIRASRQRVFDAWTRPENMRQWFGPNRTIASLEIDPRKNGDYLIELEGGPCDSTQAKADIAPNVVISGRYVTVDPYDLLSFTWASNLDPSEETLVTITFKDIAEGTEVVLTHERFATELSRQRHEVGWTGAIDKLKTFAESNS